MRRTRIGLMVGLVLWHLPVHAGAQREESLADSVRTLLRQAVLTSAPAQRPFATEEEYNAYVRWQNRLSVPLSRFVINSTAQQNLLRVVDYEAHRAGLEPSLVLAVIEVESRFHPNAVSPVQARGLMQVMPFWTKSIGDGRVKSLHDARINIRYGCVILRHYLDQEHGSMVRALARYNGSLGQVKYPLQVLAAQQHWQ